MQLLQWDLDKSGLDKSGLPWYDYDKMTYFHNPQNNLLVIIFRSKQIRGEPCERSGWFPETAILK